MEIVWITALIFILYSRTMSYHFMIDDIVRRWGYLYCVPEVSPPYSFYNSKPSKWRHLFPIITHILNTFVVNLLWGWKVALIFAVHPVAVTGTAWITGGYYTVTTFLTLTAYYFIHTYHLIGALIGSLFFTAALGSTITCIGFPFLFLFGEHNGLVCFWPLVMYLFGKRFLTGFGIRNAGKKDQITLRKLAVMPKVVAYYALIALVPYKLAFFRQFGFEYSQSSKMKENVDSFNFEFYLSVVFLSVFAWAGWLISPFATLWFFITIAPFSQFKMLGQFIAERYSYLPNVGISILIAMALDKYPYLYTIVATLFLYRSHLYIPAFRHMRDLYNDGIKNYPECVTNFANLAETYLQGGEHLRAYQTMEEGLKLDPNCFLLHCNMAAYWIQVNNLERGLMHTEKALDVHSDKTDGAFFVMNKQKNDLVNMLALRKKEYERIDKEEEILNKKPKNRLKVKSSTNGHVDIMNKKEKYTVVDNKFHAEAKEMVRRNRASIS